MAALIAVWRVPASETFSSFEIQAAVAAILAGVLWAVEPWVGALDGTSTGNAWPWQAAALLLLPVIIGVRDRERRAAPWLGAIGWMLGWLVPFVAAGLAAGIGLPLIDALGGRDRVSRILVLPIATVPFAVIAAWCRVYRFLTAVLLVAARSPRQHSARRIPATRPESVVGPLLFGAGWLVAGVTWLGSDREGLQARS